MLIIIWQDRTLGKTSTKRLHKPTGNGNTVTRSRGPFARGARARSLSPAPFARRYRSRNQKTLSRGPPPARTAATARTRGTRSGCRRTVTRAWGRGRYQSVLHTACQCYIRVFNTFATLPRSTTPHVKSEAPVLSHSVRDISPQCKWHTSHRCPHTKMGKETKQYKHTIHGL